MIWEQHPSSDRYQRAVFENFFKGAMQSGGAFRVIDNTNGELIGSSRYSNYEEAKRQIDIGYTFIARSRWARHYNRALKTLMLDHAFKYVDRVIFKVGDQQLALAQGDGEARRHVYRRGVGELFRRAEPSQCDIQDRRQGLGRPGALSGLPMR